MSITLITKQIDSRLKNKLVTLICADALMISGGDAMGKPVAGILYKH